MYLTNAFSLSMLASFPDLGQGDGEVLRVKALSPEKARELLADGFVSAVGHADTACLLTGILGVPVACNRASIVLQPGETVLVAQYNGPRLPEGTKTLPEGAEFRFLRVATESAETRFRRESMEYHG